MKLTPKQKKFCEHYASSGNATASAIKSGYSKKSARQIANENLTKPYIQEYIQKLTKPQADKRIMSIEERQEWLSKIIAGEVKEQIGIYENGDTITIEMPAKLDTVLKASEQLNRMQGAYLDRVEVEDVTPKWFKKKK
jgi:phage terminase small subunit